MPKPGKSRPDNRAASIGSYSELLDWLTENGARCMWQLPAVGDQSVGCWRVGKGVAIVVTHANQAGWDIYTACDSNDIAETLADAAHRCGLGEKS